MKKERLFYLDCIRTFACIIILIFHFSRVTDGYQIYGFPKLDLFANGDWGFIAVAIFFLLSGFSIMYSYNDKKLDIKKFYLKRFKSIYPFFWISYILVFIYYFITTGTVANYEAIRNNPIKLILGGILTILGLDGYLSYTFYLIGEWFLPCIIIFYVFFPFFKKEMEKNPKVFFLFSFVIYILTLVLEKYSPILIHRNILICAFQFILGMYLCKYEIFIKSKLNFVMSLFVTISILYFKLNVHSSILVTIISILLFNILRFLTLNMKKNLLSKIIQYISKKSFLIFLLHHVIFNEILKYFKNIDICLIEAIVLFLLCLIVILLLCEIVENICFLISRKCKFKLPMHS